jgi:hypothetical protein
MMPEMPVTHPFEWLMADPVFAVILWIFGVVASSAIIALIWSRYR